MPNIFSIREYGTIWQGEGTNTLNSIFLAQSSFELLENWVLEGIGEQIMVFGKKQGKPFFKVKNFVGVIELKDSTQIEILPKITQNEEDIVSSKKALLKMLHYVQDIPFKISQDAQLQTENLNIFEIFINSFLKQLHLLIQKGIKSDYQEIAENQNFLKGKLQFQEQIKHNLVHQERFFVAYDGYMADIAPNRIIKTTLQKLAKVSRNAQNKQKIKMYQEVYVDIPFSNNIAKDLATCEHLNRFFQHYKLVLEWCRVFLENKSFTSFSGNCVNWAILFPMQVVFESYIGSLFRRYSFNYSISLQDKSHYLLEQPKQFSLCPDMVVYQADTAIQVLDTKWKILDTSEPNLGIQQSDLYQIFAYAKKYNVQKLVLIYPAPSEQTSAIVHWQYEESISLYITHFPVYQIDREDFEAEKRFVEQILNL